MLSHHNKKTHLSKTDQTSEQNNKKPAEPYSRSLFFTFLIYVLIAIIIIAIVKFKAESYVGTLIRRIMESTISRFANGFQKGYSPSNVEEEEIDYGDKV